MARSFLLASLSLGGALIRYGFARFLWCSQRWWLRSDYLALSFVVGFAPAEWRSHTLRLRSMFLARSTELASLCLFGTLVTDSFARVHWHALTEWLRSYYVALSLALASLVTLGTLGLAGFAL